MQVQRIQSNDYNTAFGLWNDKKVAHRVLNNVDPELRKGIYQNLDKFCKSTQSKGIKGFIRLDKIKQRKYGRYGVKTPMLSYSIKLSQSN